MPKITLKAARVNVGLNQQEAAKALKVDKSTLSSWERGVTFPTADQIALLCELYGVSYDHINFLPNNPL